MNVKDFILLYEEKKPHLEKLPNIKAKKIKSFLSSINKAYSKNRDVEGRANFMIFVSNLEQLYDNLQYIEKKDPTLVNKEDVKDCNDLKEKILKYLRKNDEVLDKLKLQKTIKGLRSYLK